MDAPRQPGGQYTCELSALWRRLDTPGHDSCRVTSRGAERELAGSAVFAHEGKPCRLEYLVVCDAGWRTRSCRVSGWVGRQAVAVEVRVNAHGQWELNGIERPGVAGAVDVDLAFSPATNILALRRFKLEVGDEKAVRAAWLSFPALALEPLDQVYRRVAAGVYRYEAAAGVGYYAEDLRVNDAGVVTDYPGLWALEAMAREGSAGT